MRVRASLSKCLERSILFRVVEAQGRLAAIELVHDQYFGFPVAFQGDGIQLTNNGTTSVPGNHREGLLFVARHAGRVGHFEVDNEIGFGGLTHCSREELKVSNISYLYKSSYHRDMQLLTIQITNSSALKAIHALEEKQAIRIVEEIDTDSPALSGKPLTLKEFKNWVAESEKAPTVSLQEAKSQWARKKKQLHKLTK